MENSVEKGSLKEAWLGFKKLYRSKYDKKLEKVYEDWQRPILYVPPFWFMLVTLIAFRSSSFMDLTEKEKIEALSVQADATLTKLQRFVKDRILAMDYTLPLPKWLYSKVYDPKKRLKNSFLIIFYNHLLGTLKARGSDTKAVEKFIESPYVTPFVKKTIKIWLDDLESGERNFNDCLQDHSEMFGKFETNVYIEANKMGISVTILERIVSNLKDLVQLDKAKAKIKRDLYLYTAINISLVYCIFGFTIPKLFNAMELESLPSDMQALFNFGEFLKTPLGVIFVIGLLLLTKLIVTSVARNELLSGYITKIPKLGDFVRFIELYLFTDTIQLFYQYMQGTDDYKIRKAINVVSNSFLRGFLSYKLNAIIKEGARTEDFFKDNKFFGEYSEYLTVQGLMKQKLSELRDILRYNKDEVLATLPEALKSVVMVMMMLLITIIVLVVARVEIFVASPSNIHM